MIGAMIRLSLFLPLILIGYFLVNQMEKRKIKINRWWFGISAFASVWIPAIFLQTLPKGFHYIFYLLCALCAVIFFELSRRSLEKRGI
ncbi:MAG: hypothetical protein ACK5NA_12110 [Enterococcus sp.]